MTSDQAKLLNLLGDYHRSVMFECRRQREQRHLDSPTALPKELDGFLGLLNVAGLLVKIEPMVQIKLTAMIDTILNNPTNYIEFVESINK